MCIIISYQNYLEVWLVLTTLSLVIYYQIYIFFILVKKLCFYFIFKENHVLDISKWNKEEKMKKSHDTRLCSL